MNSTRKKLFGIELADKLSVLLNRILYLKAVAERDKRSEDIATLSKKAMMLEKKIKSLLSKADSLYFTESMSLKEKIEQSTVRLEKEIEKITQKKKLVLCVVEISEFIDEIISLLAKFSV